MATRWSDADVPRGDVYDERFARLEATGVDVHGEASLVEALLVEHGLGRSVLDAGCGTGRVAIQLARRGHDVVGVDLDPSMLDAARRKAPELDFRTADLAELDLHGVHFDAAVLAGNVMIFLASGTEASVVQRIASHLLPGGLLVAGFQLGRTLSLDDYDTLARDAGLAAVARYSTWDGAPYAGGDYVVTVDRKP